MNVGVRIHQTQLIHLLRGVIAHARLRQTPPRRRNGRARRLCRCRFRLLIDRHDFRILAIVAYDVRGGMRRIGWVNPIDNLEIPQVRILRRWSYGIVIPCCPFCIRCRIGFHVSAYACLCTCLIVIGYVVNTFSVCTVFCPNGDDSRRSTDWRSTAGISCLFVVPQIPRVLTP